MSNFTYNPIDSPPTKLRKPSAPDLAEPGKPCRLKVNFGVYFDGTNNSRYEDEGWRSHTNVARLYNAALKEPVNGFNAIYVQGVGTAFKEIGEPEPHPNGSRYGAMGSERIRYAQVVIANRISYIIDRGLFVKEDEDHLPQVLVDDKKFHGWRRRLTQKISGSRVSFDEIVLDVFGFSRGAAAARSFLHQFQRNWCDVPGIYCGIPLRIRFVGLFDTVSSVGLADSVPGPFEGHQDWGDESLLPIPPQVEQCVHLVAGHEARASFPVDLVLSREGHYPKGCLEIVYPGMHSDVGGGYGPSSQGKGSLLNAGLEQQDGNMLSQIALNDMYERARKAGVPLRSREELDRSDLLQDFAVSPAVRSHFKAYVQAVAPEVNGQPAIKHMRAHRRRYLGWRKQILASATYERQLFVRYAKPQDRVNLIQANAELGRQIAGLREYERKVNLEKEKVWHHRRTVLPEVDQSLVAFYYDDWSPAPSPSDLMMEFFNQYVHDSRAGFILTDPASDYDHRMVHGRLEAKDKTYQAQRVAYERKAEQIRAPSSPSGNHYDAWGMMPPKDPLTAQERENLGIYRQGRNPVHSDERPGFRSDADFGAKHVILGAMDSRREILWSYLHPRQVFAYHRLSY